MNAYSMDGRLLSVSVTPADAQALANMLGQVIFLGEGGAAQEFRPEEGI